jgi:WD40 repeat protein
VARPPSRWYEFQKTVRRHKFGFAASAAVMLALAGGVVVSSWQAMRARKAEREQGLLREEAEVANRWASRELRTTLINEARLATLSDTLARRDLATAALSRAAEIEPTAEMLQTAVTALSMFQVRDLGMQIPSVPGQLWVAISRELTRYAWHGGEQPSMEIRSFPDHQVIQQFSWEPRGFWDFLQWLPGGERVVARHRDGPLELWNIGSGDVGWSVPVTRQDWSESMDLGHLALDATGRWIAHIDRDSKVELIDAATGVLRTTLAPGSLPACLAFHPTRPWLAIGTSQGVEVFDHEVSARIRVRESGHRCRFVTWSPNHPDTVAHIGSAYRLELWDLSWDRNFQVPGIGGYRATARFSGDRRWLATSDGEGLLAIRHPESTRPMVEGLNGYPVAFGADGNRLFCQAGSSGVKAYELSPSVCHTELELPIFADSSVPGVAISSDERWVAATSYSNGVYVWDLVNEGTPAFARFFQCHGAVFNTSGNQLLTLSEQRILSWDWTEGPEGHRLGGPKTVVESHTGSERRPTFVLSQPPQIVVPSKGTNWLLSRDDLSILRQLPSRDQSSAALSPDGRWLAESSFHSPIYLTDLSTGEQRPDVSPQGGLLAFSPDGRWLTSGRGGSVEAWDSSTWTRAWQIATETVNQDSGQCVFRPQGDLLATLESPKDIVLLRPSDGQRLLRLVAPRPGAIDRMCFSESGRTLAASTLDGRIQIWRLDELEMNLKKMGLDWTELAGMPRIAE